MLRRLAESDKRLLEHDVVLRAVVERRQPLLDGATADEAAPADGGAKRKIGFHDGNR